MGKLRLSPEVGQPVSREAEFEPMPSGFSGLLVITTLINSTKGVSLKEVMRHRQRLTSLSFNVQRFGESKASWLPRDVWLDDRTSGICFKINADVGIGWGMRAQG